MIAFDGVVCALRGAVERADADCIALSGGLDSTVLAHLAAGKAPVALAVAAAGTPPPDLQYCRIAAEHCGLDLEIVRPEIPELAAAAERCVEILGNFNDIEIRNSAVMYALLSAAKESGLRTVMTGDGADELFAGYAFMSRLEPERLRPELERIWNIMHFTSQAIADSLGIGIISPFLDGGVMDTAKSLDSGLLIGTRDGTRYGKFALRCAFESEIPRKIAWREKAAMQDGAGTAGLTAHFERTIGDGEFASKADRILEDDGVRLRSKESLFYYEAYRKNHGPPRGGGCPHCGGSVSKGSRFCRMCGAYPV